MSDHQSCKLIRPNSCVTCSLKLHQEGTAVYSSGVDQKVIQYSYIKTHQSTANQSSILSRPLTRWVQSVGRRLHSHDVRALAIWPPHCPLPPSHRRQFPLDIAPILASGGLDMSVVVTPAALPSSTITKIINPLSTSQAATYEDSYHRRLAYNSGAFNASALHLARQARLLLCQRDAGVSIWRIREKERGPGEGEEDAESAEPPPSIGGWEPVLDMDLTVHTNLIASAISDDGRWVVVSDWYESKLFRLHRLVRNPLFRTLNHVNIFVGLFCRTTANLNPSAYVTSRLSSRPTSQARPIRRARLASASHPMARSSSWLVR